jgi:di/tricarboxylate transporter
MTFVERGLSEFLGDQFATFDLSVGLVFLMISVIIWFTELTSNASTSNIIVPIAASIAMASQANPYTFMLKCRQSIFSFPVLSWYTSSWLFHPARVT